MEKFSLTVTDEFLEYCKLNNIEDIEGFAIKVFTTGFNVTKYGNNPVVKKPNEMEKPKINIKNNNLYDE